MYINIYIYIYIFSIYKTKVWKMRKMSKTKKYAFIKSNIYLLFINTKYITYNMLKIFNKNVYIYIYNYI